MDTQKCNITGSDDPDLIQHLVPIEWTRKTAGKKDSQDIYGDVAATTEDMEKFEHFRRDALGQSSDSSAPNFVSVKQEKLSPEDLKKKDELEKKKMVEDFKANTVANIKVMTDDLADLRIIEARAKPDALTKAVAEKADEIRVKASKCLKALEQLMLNPDGVEDKIVTSLSSTMRGMKKEIDDFKDRAALMGVGVTTTKKRARAQR